MKLAQVARVMYRRRRIVVLVWLAAVIGLSVVAGKWGGDHTADYGIQGSESAAAATLLAENLPEMSGDLVQLVVAAPEGVDEPAIASQISAVVTAIADVDHVRSVQPLVISADGTIALANVQLDAATEQVPVESIEAIMHIAEQARADGLQVETGGQAIQLVETSEAGSEQIGMLLALVILLVAFGSVFAAALPIVVALFGVGVGLAVGQLLNHVFEVPDWAPQLVTMIGIGVGIDYALFVVVRYRSGLAEGRDPESAVVHAISTAGRAVLFAGGTVVISLLGLCAMGMSYLYGTAAVTVTGVLVMLVASLTLLPALLGFAGTRIDRLALPWARAEQTDGIWYRWSRIIQRRPLVTGLVALLALVALAVPFTNLRFGYPDGGSGPADLSSRRAYDLTAEGFGPGANGPFVIAVDAGTDAEALTLVSNTIAGQPGVAAVLPPVISSDGSTAALFVVPATGPQDAATVDLVHDLRGVVPQALADADSAAEAYIGGSTAAYIDESEYLSGRLPWFIGSVIALAFALLLVVFRSVLVALKAALMNLLAIGAAYGVMALALRGGWFGGLLGIDEPTPIPAWAPMMMFALLFGLSMDYEVFLLSRIREEYDRTKDNASAVADGLAKTARVISAAAAIMVTVFAAFMLADSVLLKVIGLGLAVAVALDATLVRMVLVPSTMELLGDRNWWLPRWLDRLLPHVHVESHGEPVEAPAVSEPVSVGADVDTERELVGV